MGPSHGAQSYAMAFDCCNLPFRPRADFVYSVVVAAMSFYIALMEGDRRVDSLFGLFFFSYKPKGQQVLRPTGRALSLTSILTASFF